LREKLLVFDHCELNTANEFFWKENELLIIPRGHIDLLLCSVYNTLRRNLLVSVEEESWSFFEIKRVPSYSLEKRNPGSLHQSLAVNGQKYTERGFKWILTVIDAFSKYLWAQPLKNKSAEEVKEHPEQDALYQGNKRA